MNPADDESTPGFSLRRWSRRKLAAARETTPAAVPSAEAAPVADGARPAAAGSIEAPASNAEVANSAEVSGSAPPGAAAQSLPPVESLSFESDFKPYLQPEVDESLRRQALRRLFQDPHFNVMDGLDIYIGDYSQPDPIPPEMLRQIVHARALLEPVTTRINAKGEVEIVVPDASAADPAPRSEDAADSGEAVPTAPAVVATEPAAATPLPAPDAASPVPAATADRRDDAIPVAHPDEGAPGR